MRWRWRAASNATYYERYNCLVALYIGLARSGQIEAAVEVVATIQRLARAAGDVYGDVAASATYALRAAPFDPTGAATSAQRAETLIAVSHNAALRTEGLGALARYYSLVGEFTRGIECCREAVALSEQYHLVRGIHHARNALAQLLMRTGTEDPLSALKDAILGAYNDRSWYDLWPTMPALAQWWIEHGQANAAAVIIGYLDAHHLASVDDDTRQRLGNSADIQRALENGARLDRDQLVAFVLEHLPVTSDNDGPARK
jgi:hypothetical protein